MNWQSRKLTRRSMLRGLGAGAVAAGAALFNEKTAFAVALGASVKPVAETVAAGPPVGPRIRTGRGP
jgi:hypothetical protein